ncbi:MAG: hypothetical protein ACJAYU_003930 [Bradymonadia bacterium]|jgi:hypothetical protein
MGNKSTLGESDDRTATLPIQPLRQSYSFKAAPDQSVVLFFCDKPRRASIRAGRSLTVEIRTSMGINKVLVAAGAVVNLQANNVRVSASSLGAQGQFWFDDTCADVTPAPKQHLRRSDTAAKQHLRRSDTAAK